MGGLGPGGSALGSNPPSSLDDCGDFEWTVLAGGKA